MAERPWDDEHQVSRLSEDRASFSFWYPRSDGSVKHLEVDLIDVRASDGIRISYDFDRDGYVIEQPWYEEIAIGPRTFDHVEHWEEVGFFKSWALKHKDIVAGEG